MKLKAPRIEIPLDNPFEHDLLKRKVTAEQLTEIIKSTDEPLVLSINAAFGNGKTTFMSMWRALLNQEGFKTLYFNAWENDHSDDALVSLIGELSGGIGELKLAGREAVKARRYLKRAKTLGAALVRKGLPTAVRFGTGGVIDLAGIDLAQAGSKISELAEEIAKEQINKYEKTKRTLAGFRVELEKFANEATLPKNGQERHSIVILVDELDRCRPPYAVQVLEKIKHLFNVPGITFVLAIDKKQLSCSIQSMYGQEMNTNGYLRRFIDLDFDLPIPTENDFCDAQFQRFGLEEFFNKRVQTLQYDSTNIAASFVSFFKAFNLSLREQEHCFALLSLAVRSTKANYPIFPFLLSLLIILKIKHHELYADFVGRRIDHEKLIEFVEATRAGRDFLLDNYGMALQIQLAACQSRENNIVNMYEAKAKDQTLDAAARKRALDIVAFYKQYASQSFQRVEGCLTYLVQKIDLVSRFDT